MCVLVSFAGVCVCWLLAIYLIYEALLIRLIGRSSAVSEINGNALSLLQFLLETAVICKP